MERSDDIHTERPLGSWKEVAAYLQRDIRTVMRWEKSEGLPVHRHQHQARGSVYAYPGELDAWRAAREIGLTKPAAASPTRQLARGVAFAASLLVAVMSVGDGRMLSGVEAADGGSGIVVRQVWAGPEVDVLGSVSADGRYLTYVDWETGDMAVRELATGNKRRLTSKGSWFESIEFALFSLVSPDGRQAAYAWFNKDFFFDLRLVGLDGSGPRVLYRNEETEYVQPTDWSPDGTHILAVLSRKDANQIAVISLADGSARVLKTLDLRYPGRMRWSPDGRHIAYDFPPDEDSPARDIFLLSADGSRETPLVEHPANDVSPIWTPDGTRVLFTSDRAGSFGLWAAPVADGKRTGPAELIKHGMGVISPLGFSGNGALHYGVEIGAMDVYTSELDLGAGRVVVPAAPVPQRFVGSNSSPDWSPDGNYLAYASRRGIVRYDPASSVLVIRALVSGKERELTPRLNHFSRPRWSPDGRHVLVQGNDRRNRQGLYKINVQTGEVAPVVQVQPGVYALEASWSPDGKEIFYRRQDSGGKIARFFVREVESGREKGLIHSAEGSFFLSPALSPDGRQLAFVLRDEKTGSTALRIMPSHGGEPRELLRVGEPEFIQYGSVEWTTDGRKILFARGRFTPQEPRGSLWQVSSRGGEPERVDLTADGMRDVRLHPDGRRVAFTAGFNRAEIWVMENFLPVREAAP